MYRCRSRLRRRLNRLGFLLRRFDAVAALTSEAQTAKLHFHRRHAAGHRRKNDTLSVHILVPPRSRARPRLRCSCSLSGDCIEARWTGVRSNGLWRERCRLLLWLGPVGLSTGGSDCRVVLCTGASDYRVVLPYIGGLMLHKRLFRKQFLFVSIGMNFFLTFGDVSSLCLQLLCCRSITPRVDRLCGRVLQCLGRNLDVLDGRLDRCDGLGFRLNWSRRNRGRLRLLLRSVCDEHRSSG